MNERTEKKNYRAAKMLVGLLAGVATLAIGADVALAHHAEISANVPCSRVISWTATAWYTDSPDPEDRTNLDVQVTYSTSNGGSGAAGSGQFVPANNFSFSGTLVWPADLPESVTLTVQPQANWGTTPWGSGLPGPSASVTVFLPEPCVPETTTTTTVPETTTTTTVPETTTTTTVPETTTTTTVPETTTTVPPTTVPPTTVPPTTVPPTTVPPTTVPEVTTTAPEVTTTTAAATTTTDSVVEQLPPVPPTTDGGVISSAVTVAPVLTVPPNSQLPVTGSDGISEMLLIALAFVGVGGIILFSRRRTQNG